MPPSLSLANHLCSRIITPDWNDHHTVQAREDQIGPASLVNKHVVERENVLLEQAFESHLKMLLGQSF